MMKKAAFLLAILVTHLNFAKAQQFEVDTILYHGDINKYINFVIMGDGYTATEQTKFMADADSFTQYYFTQPPFSNYAGYFNVFAIKVISQESGAKHPETASDCSGNNVPKANPNNYFGSTFDYFNIHRLVVATKTSEIANVLANNFPNYDQSLILVNSPYYGGSGGEFPVATTDIYSIEVAVHELGHSFGFLADEYWAGPAYAVEKANLTQISDTVKIKWKNWLNAGTNIGIFAHQEDPNWHRPHQSCKMRFLGSPFCSVCHETLLEKIHSLTNPVVDYYPKTLNINTTYKFLNFALPELMKPAPNTLQINWKMDGNIVAHNSDTLLINQSLLTNGNHTLTVSVLDTSSFTRSNSHTSAHISTVTWNISKSVVGINLQSETNKIGFTIYPNPASDILNISLDAEKTITAGYEIVSLDGKIIQHVNTENISAGEHRFTINIADLPQGIYNIILRINNEVYSRSFVKQ